MENKEVIIVTAYHILGKSEKDKICRQMRSEIFNLLFQFPKVLLFEGLFLDQNIPMQSW